MAWASTTVASGFDAEQYAQTAMDSRQASRSGIGSGRGNSNTWWPFDKVDGYQGLSEYSVVGINVSKVPDMREAIRSAVANIQNHIDGIEEETNSSNAFRSEEIKTAVEQYVLAVKDYCKALISDLLAFSDKLESVHQAWLQSTQSYASESIDSSKSNVSSSATYYTEQ